MRIHKHLTTVFMPESKAVRTALKKARVMNLRDFSFFYRSGDSSHPGSFKAQRGNVRQGCLCSSLETRCRRKRYWRILRKVLRYQLKCKVRLLEWPGCSRRSEKNTGGIHFKAVLISCEYC